VYDASDGGHLRIEMRALPAGPTTIDMLANAAFLVGLHNNTGHNPPYGADAVARRGLEACLERATLEQRRVEAPSMRILVDPVRVAVRRGVELAFGDGPVAGADFTVATDIDRHNFERVAPGTPLGWLGPRGVWPVEARGETGRDTSGELFEVAEGRLQTRRSMIPIMMTTSRSNALAYCLFYVVEEGRPVGRS
jgi:hypothetical protein